MKEPKFPFKLSHVFFVTLKFHRAEHVPNDTRLEFDATVGLSDENFPNSLNVLLKLETKVDQPVEIQLELVGIFELIDPIYAPSKEMIAPFINEQAMFMLWPHLSQIMRQVTALMAIPAVDMKIPYQFDFFGDSINSLPQ